LYKQYGCKYKVHDKEELYNIICDLTTPDHKKYSLNWIDTSEITDMSFLFSSNKLKSISNICGTRIHYTEKAETTAYLFDGDISEWNVSNVTDMSHMFFCSKFAGDISKWNVSKVTDMNGMFSFSMVCCDISKWDVSKVTDMGYMFSNAKIFNNPISEWDVSNVTNMDQMFIDSKFNQDISKWDVRNVENMFMMFSGTPFNQPLINWKDKVYNVRMANAMFKNSSFAYDISGWKFHPDIKYTSSSDNVKYNEMFIGSPMEKKLRVNYATGEIEKIIRGKKVNK